MKYSRSVQILTTSLILLFALVFAVPATVDGKGRILKVGPGHPYTTIQEAVIDASNGSKIYVFPADAPGYYHENVSINKNNLKIIAQGAGVTVRALQNYKATFTVYADHVVIRGFDQLTGDINTPGILFEGSYNTFADNVINPGPGPGVNAITCRDHDGGSNFNRIENNTIIHGDIGIALIATLPTSALNVGNIISNNTILGIAQNGISVGNGIGFTISGNNIPQSPIHDCIGVTAYNNLAQGYHQIKNNTVAGCAGNGGIALYADDSTTLSHNHIVKNEISYSGSNGIFLYAEPNATLSDNLILNNRVHNNSANGIFLNTGVNHNRILKNYVMNNSIVGIEIHGDNNKIVGNTALDNGDFDIYDRGADNKWINNTYETSDPNPLTNEARTNMDTADLLHLNLPLVYKE